MILQNQCLLLVANKQQILLAYSKSIFWEYFKFMSKSRQRRWSVKTLNICVVVEFSKISINLQCSAGVHNTYRLWCRTDRMYYSSEIFLQNSAITAVFVLLYRHRVGWNLIDDVSTQMVSKILYIKNTTYIQRVFSFVHKLHRM